ncbi:hypothetical protein NQ318_009532 [Aromia moschata]|uniref:Uncharacterized protein n=1 Tax=Aromia moschata TaxID=1265417 RepID=A0AAV8Y9V5_9CUCU|nr:hypothetical protein NQ318_009532 [Aromia moschata]
MWGLASYPRLSVQALGTGGVEASWWITESEQKVSSGAGDGEEWALPNRLQIMMLIWKKTIERFFFIPPRRLEPRRQNCGFSLYNATGSNMSASIGAMLKGGGGVEIVKPPVPVPHGLPIINELDGFCRLSSLPKENNQFYKDEPASNTDAGNQQMSTSIL